MNIRLIIMKLNLTQKEKSLMESWVQSYLIIYPSLSFSNVGLKFPLCLCTSLFFLTWVLESWSSHNLNNLNWLSFLDFSIFLSILSLGVYIDLSPPTLSCHRNPISTITLTLSLNLSRTLIPTSIWICESESWTKIDFPFSHAWVQLKFRVCIKLGFLSCINLSTDQVWIWVKLVTKLTWSFNSWSWNNNAN